MQAEKQQQQQQSWKVSIQARAESFSFKLKATKLLPSSWKFNRLCLLLRLHNFILKLQVKSGSTVSISTRQKRTLKSAFLALAQKLRIRKPKKKTFTFQYLNRLKQFANERSIFAGSLVIGVLATLLQSISNKDFNKGLFMVQASIVILMCWILYLKRYITGKSIITFWMVGIALHFGKGYMFKTSRLLLLAVGNAALQVTFALLKIFFSSIFKLKE